jgi:tRNA A37 threonylcarbamoyladenosine dehydratase
MLDDDFTVVIDAIDQVRAKVAMIAFCKRRKLPIVIAGAAGGQIDPTQIRVSDLSQTVQDPLLAKVRSTLRRDHGFPRDPRKNSAFRPSIPPSHCATRRTMLPAMPSAARPASIVPVSVRRSA